MKTIIVTAADEKYSRLLLGLVNSLTQWGGRSPHPIGVLDLGLSEATLRNLDGKITEVAKPEWDLIIDRELQLSKPHLRAFLVRPFLRKYFPNYDLYLWLDSDTWVQEQYAIDWFIRAAQNGHMGLVSQFDRSYVHTSYLYNERIRKLESYFGEGTEHYLVSYAYYNSGAFSLRANAPHWEAWAKYHQEGLKKSPRLLCDQTALNYAIWQDNLPVHPLPALCNWCCHLAIPAIDLQTRKLREPHIPARPIGVVHLTGDTKHFRFRINSKDGSAYGTLQYRGLPDLPQ